MAETRIGVIGCGGRMGRMLVADIVATEGCSLGKGMPRQAVIDNTDLNLDRGYTDPPPRSFDAILGSGQGARRLPVKHYPFL